MKKTILASVIAGLGVGFTGTVLAQTPTSNVQLYGLMDAFVSNEKTPAGSTMKVDGGGMTTSFWGIKGSEDLGGGIKAIFALESFISNDTGGAGRFAADQYFARSAFVGIEAGFGKVTLGRNTTPYFVSTLLANPFGDSFAFSPEILRTYAARGYLIGDTGWGNSIAYSGNFGSVGVNAIYTLGDESPANSGGKGFGLSANYFAGPLMISGAYQTRNAGATTFPALVGKQNAFRLGAAYNLGPAKLFGSYQTISDKDGLVTAGVTNGSHDGFQIGVSAPAGPGEVLVSYGRTKSSAGVVSDSRNVFALGYDYKLSKQTDVYAAFYKDGGYSALAPSWNGSIERLGFGIRHRF
jgi:predicted porin